jgi:hypothetical protein
MTEGAPTTKFSGVKTPPVLLLATLLFWGQQSDLVTFGAIMGVILESARLVKLRLDVTADDFRRLRNFCGLLALALALYAFSTNKLAGGLSSWLHASGANAGHDAEIASLNTATALFRWLPMTLFLLVAAEAFSERQAVPLSALSMYFRRHRQRSGGQTPERYVDVTYAYFIICLFSAGIHNNDGGRTFFWGQCILLPWALWPLRSRRFGLAIWIVICAVVVAAGFGGQFGIGQAGRLLENYDAQWIARWMHQRTDALQSQTAIGRIGRLKLSSRIVIRLKPENGTLPPAYLREASYRDYNSQKQVWYAGGGVHNDFDQVAQGNSAGDAWLLLRAKTNTSAINIACYLEGRSPDGAEFEGLLPLPPGSSRLENLPVISLGKNKTGSVLASSASGLAIFDAFYGPGETIDSAPDDRLDYLVPTNEVSALKQAISEINFSGTREDQKLLAVQNFFSDKFTYSTWQKVDKLATTNESSLTKFLLHSRTGHCEYFATATVLLLRELGIPARYAVGYAVHEPKGSGYVVRERDAHAWCLVWNRPAGAWENFDTTPASWVEAEGANTADWFSDFWSWIGFEISKGKLRLSQADYREYMIWALIPLMLLLLAQIIFRRRKRLPTGHNSVAAESFSWPGLDSEFYRLEKKLAEHGVPRQPGEPLSHWLERTLTEPALADLRAPLKQLLQLHYRHRFDPRGLSAAEREQFRQDVQTCLDNLSHPVSH